MPGSRVLYPQCSQARLVCPFPLRFCCATTVAHFGKACQILLPVDIDIDQLLLKPVVAEILFGAQLPITPGPKYCWIKSLTMRLQWSIYTYNSMHLPLER